MKEQQKKAILNLSDLWEPDEVEEPVAGIAGAAKQKQTALKEQWKCVEAWCKKTKVKFPFERQPKGSALATWKQAVQQLLNTEEAKQVQRLRLTEAEQDNQPKKHAVQILEEKTRSYSYVARDEQTLQVWCREVINSADSDVDRSRRHRAQRMARDNLIPPAARPQAGAASSCLVEGQAAQVDEDEAGPGLEEAIEIRDENGDSEIETLFDWAGSVDVESV